MKRDSERGQTTSLVSILQPRKTVGSKSYFVILCFYSGSRNYFNKSQNSIAKLMQFLYYRLNLKIGLRIV